MKSDLLELPGAELLEQMDTPIPCMVPPHNRADWCEQTVEHPADWERLWSCGCLTYTCDTFDTKWILTRTTPFCCDICHAAPIEVVSLERIR